jgi:hypothetical protein
MILAIFFICSTLSCINISQAQNSPQDYLEVHNQARDEVGVGPLYWDHNLEAYAQNYANKRIKDCELEHSMGPYGENLAEGYGEVNGTDSVKFWLSEKPNYDYHSNSCVMMSVGIILKLFGVIQFILVVLSPNVRMVGFLSFVAIHHLEMLKENDHIDFLLYIF